MFALSFFIRFGWPAGRSFRPGQLEAMDSIDILMQRAQDTDDSVLVDLPTGERKVLLLITQ
jgi:hypothetical protein